MARILIATIPVAGHLSPLVPLCRALVSAGHEVGWYTGSLYKSRVEAAGASYFGYESARDYDGTRLDEEFPERARLKELPKLIFDMKHFFIDSAPAQHEDLLHILERFPADVVLADPGMLGSFFTREKTGVPLVIVGVLPMVISSVDAAPFGPGLQPATGVLGRLRNRALHAFFQRVLFGGVQKHWNETRARIGLPPTGWWMDTVASATAFLQPTVPGFEYPRSDLPPNVRFIGAIPGDRHPDVPTPPFWHELDGARPVVHVTQGTVANAAPDLIQPALDGLADEDVLVVVSTGGRPVESLGLRRIPANVRIATFLSYPELLPRTAAMVTNGGYGGTQMALSHGVPLVVAGRTEDKPEVSARVAWSGAGIDLKTARPKPQAVRDAVRAVLRDRRYKARATALAAEYARYDAIALAVEAVEGAISDGVGAA
jgi:MGT family glycosyltransferase